MTESIKNTVIGGVFTIIGATIGAAIGAYGMYLSSENSDQTLEQNYQALQDENEQLKETIEEMSGEIKSLKEQLEVQETDSDKPDNEVEGTDSSSVSQNERTRLKDLAQVDPFYYELLEPFTDSYGNLYEIGYQFDASNNAYAVYGLQGEYTSFSGRIVCSEATGSGADMSMMIYKDDELIDTITNINKQVETKEIGPYDISGARRLTIKTSNNGDYPNGWCYLVNAFVE